MTKREQLVTWLQDSGKLADWRARGRKAVGGTHNACAATASQPFIDLGIIPRTVTWAETLATDLKLTGAFKASGDRGDVQPGDVVVCLDLNDNGAADHIWLVAKDYGNGWYGCFDNQTKYLIHRRRLDGADGKTAMRGRLRLTI